MRKMILIAALVAGCSYGSNYEAADRSGNQCRNECMAAPDEQLLESCFKNCYHYHGGEFWPGDSCAIQPAESIYKEPPKNPEKVDEFPAPELEPTPQPI